MSTLTDAFCGELVKVGGLQSLARNVLKNVREITHNRELQDSIMRAAALGAGTSAVSTLMHPEEQRRWGRNLASGALAGALTGVVFPGWFHHSATRIG